MASPAQSYGALTRADTCGPDGFSRVAIQSGESPDLTGGKTASMYAIEIGGENRTEISGFFCVISKKSTAPIRVCPQCQVAHLLIGTKVFSAKRLRFSAVT
jgi:hypothetical protein